MQFITLDKTTGSSLWEVLAAVCTMLTPGLAPDGLVRWLPAKGWPLSDVLLPAAPVKAFLLPQNEVVWGNASDAATLRPTALIGVTLCDLAAVAVLDRVFAADSGWQRRRHNLFLVGMPCAGDADCFCSSWSKLPACDLYVDQNRRLWLVSPRAIALYTKAGFPGERDERGPVLPLGKQTAATGALFEQPLPQPEALAAAAARCLGCGVCTAVCPTCQCFDLREAIGDDNVVQRLRVWDSCQFAEHGRVAGDNFRPQQVDRLRFRLEHKLHGFGPERGEVTCVGCGRCARACPSGLGLHSLLAPDAGGRS